MDIKTEENNCIFCKIVNKEIKSNIILENEYCIVFSDINPRAKIHLLIVPKIHVKDIMEIDVDLMSKILETIKEVVRFKRLEYFRIVNNCGKNAGQTVFHAHFHLLSGQKLEE